MTAKPRIAIDFTSLDHLSLSNGQYRYGVELMRGLADLQTDAQFILWGSNPEPPEDVAELMYNGHRRWQYAQVPHGSYRGAYFTDHARFALEIARQRIDLLHALHTFLPAAKLCRTVVTEHDLMFDLFEEYKPARESRPYRWYRRAAAAADRIIAISNTTAEDLHRIHGIPRNKIDVVYHGSSFVQGAQARQSQHAAEPRTVLVSPYNLEPRKNLESLIIAFSLLSRTHPSLQLVLFGNAALTPERKRDFEELLDEWQVRQRVSRVGFVSDAKLRELYAGCLAFVFPSVYEGFGLPILEAMANGACVIARNASAMAEVVGKAGILIETRNPEVLADAIRMLIKTPSLRTYCSEAAVERAQSFSIARMAAETYESYRKAMGNKAPGNFTAGGDVKQRAAVLR